MNLSKNTVFTIFLYGFSFSSWSQESSTKYSTLTLYPEQKESGGTKVFIIGDNQTIYSLRGSKLSKHYTAVSIDASMNEGPERELVYDEQDKKLIVTHMFHTKDHLACLAYYE